MTLLLRYVVEAYFNKSFTASKKCKCLSDADKRVSAMKGVHYPDGNKKYSKFIVYDENDKIIKVYG